MWKVLQQGKLQCLSVSKDMMPPCRMEPSAILIGSNNVSQTGSALAKETLASQWLGAVVARVRSSVNIINLVAVSAEK